MRRGTLCMRTMHHMTCAHRISVASFSAQWWRVGDLRLIQCVLGEVLLTLRFAWLFFMLTLTEAERQRADAALAELATRSQQLSDADDALVELQRASKRREAKQAMHIRRLEQQVLQLESQLAESNAARSLLEEKSVGSFHIQPHVAREMLTQ